MKIILISLVIIAMLFTGIFMYSYKSVGTKPDGSNNFSNYVPALEKVSNTFGVSLASISMASSSLFRGIHKNKYLIRLELHWVGT